MTSWQRPLERNKRDRINARFAVDDHDEVYEDFIYPVWSPSSLAREGRVAILHSTTDGIKGEYFGTGQKNALVRRALGMDPTLVSEMGVVWKKIIGTPPKSLVLEYRDLTMQALDAADVDFVLLHGAAAMSLWRPGLTLAQVRGKLGLWNKRWWVWTVPQVDGVMGHRGEITMAEWEGLVGRFGQIVNEFDPFKFTSHGCAARVGDRTCGMDVSWWDDDNLPWCDMHRGKAEEKRAVDKRKVEREARKMSVVSMEEMGLFDE